MMNEMAPAMDDDGQHTEEDMMDEKFPMMATTTRMDLLEVEVGDDDDEKEDYNSDDNNDNDGVDSATTTPTSNRSVLSLSLSRFSGHRPWRRFRYGAGPARVGAPSWWTEIRNIETTGCTFGFAYILVSFFLMAALFNMREIVGDYCLGKQELQREEYRENMVKAMGLRRRSPWDTVDQEDRFEKELEANLFYDHKGQVGDDAEYLRRHRVPIIRPPSDEEEDDSNEEDEDVELWYP